jgi:hypothetical protein
MKLVRVLLLFILRTLAEVEGKHVEDRRDASKRDASKRDASRRDVGSHCAENRRVESINRQKGELHDPSTHVIYCKSQKKRTP